MRGREKQEDRDRGEGVIQERLGHRRTVKAEKYQRKTEEKKTEKKERWAARSSSERRELEFKQESKKEDEEVLRRKKSLAERTKGPRRSVVLNP